MNDGVDELLNGCKNECSKPPLTYEPTRYVRYDECYQMRKSFKTSVSEEFKEMNERLDKRDEKLDKKIDKIYEKQDSNSKLLFGLLVSIIAGVVVGIILWALSVIM